MKAVYDGDEPKLRQATAYVNSLSADDRFWEQIAARDPFEFTSLSPAEIARRIRASPSAITIRVWTPPPADRAKFRDTVAVTDTRCPWTLFYQSGMIGSHSVADMVNTIVHEFVHSVDMFGDGDPAVEYGHGDQLAAGKENSPPYWIGALAQRLHRSHHRASVGGAPKGEVQRLSEGVRGRDAADAPEAGQSRDGPPSR